MSHAGSKSSFSHQRCLNNIEMEGPFWFWESLWPFMSALDVTRARGTAKSFNDAKKYGRCAELFFFLLQKHAPWNRPDRTRTREHRKPDFCCPFSLGWQTRVSPLAMTLCDAQGLHAPETLTRGTHVDCLSLKVSHPHKFAECCAQLCIEAVKNPHPSCCDPPHLRLSCGTLTPSTSCVSIHRV